MKARNSVRSFALVLSICCAQGSAKAENAVPRIELAQSDAAKRLDEKLKAAAPTGAENSGDACAALSVPGFTLTCGKLIPFGAMLGAVPVSQTASSLADCASRCRTVPKCVAFSYDAGASAGNHSCYLTGSITRYQDGRDWIAGTR
jgi:PAN domain-containing protein